jgi:oligopeptide/dipeptide ABC transporter ATP-binding protein
MANTLLEVKNLKTYFRLDEGTLKAVDGVSFTVGERSTLGLIGESGCGKSVTARSILRLIDPPGKVVGGSIPFKMDGQIVDLVALDPYGDEIRDIRGREISMIFQEPMRSLSPVHTIGEQIMEMILLHRTQDHSEAKEIALQMLAQVGMANPHLRFNSYPHQLSGGLCQRAMIAMALSCHPSLLIADEPTTALDVTVQAQILDLMRRLQEQFSMSILYITHDLGVVAEVCDYVAVMYLGRIVEQAPTKELFKSPLHPYTERLLRSVPRLGKRAGARLETIQGTVPLPLDPPRQCGFYSRCPEAKAGKCDREIPALVEVAEGHSVRCFLHSGGSEAENE